jgi:hypothetical protein
MKFQEDLANVRHSLQNNLTIVVKQYNVTDVNKRKEKSHKCHLYKDNNLAKY